MRIPKTSRGRLLALAKDVLLQLKTRRLQVSANKNYCRIIDGSVEAGPLRPQLSKIKSCQVCALGALFLSKVGLYNQYDIPPNPCYPEWSAYVLNNGNTDVHDFVGDPEVTHRIEALFEQNTYSGDIRCPKLTKNDRARLHAIMQNIVDNKGQLTL